MPTVSIIVPNYNHAKYLPQRLESIFNQTFQDFEVILLDDHSTDSSAELLTTYSSHPKVSHVIVNSINTGSPFEQWKKGITLALGSYIWMAESDDVADHSFLAALVPVLQNSPTVGIAYCQSQIIDDQGKLLHSNTRWTSDLHADLWNNSFQMKGATVVQDYMLFKNVIPNASAVLFRKQLFHTISQPLEKFKFVGDWMAWIQILAKSDLYFTSLPLNHFRLHSNVTRNRKTVERKIQYFLEVYSVIYEIPANKERQEKAYNFLGRKVYRKFGAWYLLTWKGFLLSKKISFFDPQFRKRMLTFFLRSKLGLKVTFPFLNIDVL